MQLCDKIIYILGKNKDCSISGEYLAKEIGVSRNAIWKAIGELRAQGFNIEAATKSGYKLSSENKHLCLSELEAHLPKSNIILLNSTDSTNKVAKQYAEDGAAERTIIIARHQTDGRGRLGRSFLSPEGGLYFSVVLRPSFNPSFTTMITSAAAVAAAKAIEEIGNKKTKIKWVNDIYISSKKVCGILTEGAFNGETGMLQYAILGVGINLCVPHEGFSDEIKETACAIWDKAPTSLEVCKILSRFIDYFFSYYDDIQSKSFMTEYKNRSILTGLTVKYTSNSKEHTAVVEGIDDDAALILRENGGIVKLNAGDISVKWDR